ncbi:MAG: FAD/NAD(P)-binding oxidoreductase [Acidithiobacillus sp.]|nr:FAD/NAD(P)-binding oxidoreductase [Acidithiobacillus sp.]
MKQIIVVGGGTGGMVAAYELQHALRATHQVTLVSDVDYFQFYPSNPWVAVGWRARQDITFPIRPHVQKKGIRFFDSGLASIDAENNTIVLKDGSKLPYDELLLSTGAKLDFDAIPGSGPHGGWTQSVCTVDHAELAHARYQEFLQNPGPVIIGAFPGASCFGPAYEYALILARDLKKRKLRDKVPSLTFVTSEPYIGHMGLGGVGESRAILTKALQDEGFEVITNAAVTHVEQGVMHVEEKDSLGVTTNVRRLPFQFSMMLPAFRGIPEIMTVPGLCNDRGMVLVDDYMQSLQYPNIHAVGLTVAIPPVETTPVPVNVPKTGYMIESMVTSIVTNLKNRSMGSPVRVKPTLNAVCIADLGDSGLVFVALPQNKPRRVDWFTQGRWVHLAKVAFEKYFMHKMKTGHSEPLYEYFSFKLLGITRTTPEEEREAS